MRATQVLCALALLHGSLSAFAEPETADESGAFPGQRAAGDLRAAGFRPLFDGNSFDGWDLKPWHEGHFTVLEGGAMGYDGQAEGRRGQDNNLWTKESFRDFTFYAEWRLPRKPEPKGHPIVLMTVVLNGEKAIDAVPLPELPEEGPIAVQHHGDPVEFRMLWVKEFGSQKQEKKSKTQGKVCK